MSLRSPTDLPALLDRLDPHAPLARRHLWLIHLVAWIRGDARDVAASVSRVHWLLDAVQSRPAWQRRWQQAWSRFTRDVDLTPLLADFGFAPRTSFLSEFGHRLGRHWLPSTPETTDVEELFGLAFSHRFDALWLRALDAQTLQRIAALLETEPFTKDPGGSYWTQTTVDAVVFAVSQISATGFANEIRVRLSPAAREGRPFHGLAPVLETWRGAVLTQGTGSAAAMAASQALREQLDTCRHAAYTVYAHLNEHGISVGIVFRLRQLRERVLRIKALLDLLQSPQPEVPTARLLADLVQVNQDRRSLRALVASSAHLTAAKVAERGAESGEHYITRDASEYLHLLQQAAGGGSLLALTTWCKFALYALGLSAFWGGLATGLNYALWFVVIQLLHFTVATKQPAFTAPAMAAKLRNIRQPRALGAFVDEVTHLLRSQFASIVGNLGLVVPVVAAISVALRAFYGQPMIDEKEAHHVVEGLYLWGPTALYAAFTGVLLFASSIIAGWVENAFVLRRLDSAITYHPRITALLGERRAARWAAFWRGQISGFAANISLGLMLGLVPAFAAFFGLSLEVRHVTLSAGQLTAAAVTLGPTVWQDPAFWSALAGVLVIGPLNLAVAFTLAMRLALRAQAISDVNRGRIFRAIRSRLRQAPSSFLLPPRHTTGAPRHG